MPRVVRVATFSPGDLFGARYRLEDVAPGVGLGEVWSALDLDRDRQAVLVKLLAPLPDPPEGAESFAELTERLQRIDDPGLPYILAAQASNERAWLVYERVEGRSLDNWLAGHRKARTTPGLTAAQRIFDQIATTLQMVHELSTRPIVHGTFSGKSVRLSPAPGGRHTLKVFDLGLGPWLYADSTEPEVDESYRAPEVGLDGAGASVRGDVFAMGALLAEMLAPGELGGTHWSRLAAESPTRVRERLGAARKDIPGALWDLLAQCFSPDPTKRPDDAGRLRALLRREWKKAGLWEKPSPAPEAEPPEVPYPALAPAPAPRSVSREPGFAPAQDPPKLAPVGQLGQLGQLAPRDGANGGWSLSAQRPASVPPAASPALSPAVLPVPAPMLAPPVPPPSFRQATPAPPVPPPVLAPLRSAPPPPPEPAHSPESTLPANATRDDFGLPSRRSFDPRVASEDTSVDLYLDNGKVVAPAPRLSDEPERPTDETHNPRPLVESTMAVSDAEAFLLRSSLAAAPPPPPRRKSPSRPPSTPPDVPRERSTPAPLPNGPSVVEGTQMLEFVWPGRAESSPQAPPAAPEGERDTFAPPRVSSVVVDGGDPFARRSVSEPAVVDVAASQPLVQSTLAMESGDVAELLKHVKPPTPSLPAPSLPAPSLPPPSLPSQPVIGAGPLPSLPPSFAAPPASGLDAQQRERVRRVLLIVAGLTLLCVGVILGAVLASRGH